MAIFLWIENRNKIKLSAILSHFVIPAFAIAFVYPSLSFWGGNSYIVLIWVFAGVTTYYLLRKTELVKKQLTLFLLSILGFYIVGYFIGNRNIDLYDLVFTIAQNNSFIMSIWNTVYFVIIDVPLTIVISLAAGLLMKNLPFFKSFFRTAFFAVSLLWLWLFNYHYGIFNFILSWFGIPAINWLNSAALTMPTVAILSIWEYFGYYGLIFLSGLQNIDQEYYEAAELEGANEFQKFTYITWPLLSPITFFVVVVSLINAFQVFTQVYVLYNQMPGPYANSGLTMVFYIYNTFYNQQQMGLASAAAYILLGIIMLLTLIQFKTSEKRVEYNI
jgi:multiple sugar transport system permease protein